jgi:uncharacterized OsmC-like protein
MTHEIVEDTYGEGVARMVGDAEKSCPVSRLLNAAVTAITVNAKLIST